MSIVLAFACAVIYGVADYCGGRASRTMVSTMVTLIGQATSLVVGIVAVALLATPSPGLRDWVWGSVAGVASAVALGSFYHALSHGAMTVVAPITAVTSAALPVAYGLLSGDRPKVMAYVGMALAVAAVALVSGAVGTRHEHARRLTVVLAFATGVGFALIFVALGRTSKSSGMWPLVASRVTSVILITGFVLVMRARSSRSRAAGSVGSPLPPLRLWGLAVLAGALDMSANFFYLLAVRRGMLSIVVVVASLYPISTVCLAFGLDRERVSKSQAAGMVLAVGALVLVSAGSVA